MAEYRADSFALVKRLRYKFKGDKKLNDALDRIVWYSFPVIYPDYQREAKKHSLELDKYYHRKHRWFKYIRGMKGTFGSLCLVTLTFDNESYEDHDTEWRKRRAKEWLQTCADYFACLDIGQKNGREHYHALCAIDMPLTTLKKGKSTYFKLADDSRNWKYGFYTIKAIKDDKQSTYKSLSYAFKASVYAFKSSKDDKGIKPFHKRGVTHWELLGDDEELPF